MRNTSLSWVLFSAALLGYTTTHHLQAQAAPPASAPTTGFVSDVDDNSATIQTPNGPMTVQLVKPVTVFTSQPSDMSHVTTNAYVGVTSVKGPDGKEHATEIHVFPEEMRGTGEGSRVMPAGGPPFGGGATGGPPPGAPAGPPSDNADGGDSRRMTNGTITRMTNGAVANGSGSEITVGGQVIDVPAGTPVTVIAPSKDPLRPGMVVMAMTTKGDDGTLRASKFMVLFSR